MVDMKNIDDKIELWHTGTGDMPLHEYLGMTWDEYSEWVHTSIIPNSVNKV